MLKKAILNNWKTDICGYAQIILELNVLGYPAWTIRMDDSYGVAIPYDGIEEVNESFASAKIRSVDIKITNGNVRRAIVLMTNSEDIKTSFTSLCEALIDPGEDGRLRRDIESSPLSWWKEWKELLGNRNIDERIYDILGELCVLKYAVKQDPEAEWNGPNGASYDIETNSVFLEVKSTINREKREVTISNQFQLFPQEKPLNLVLCRFEPVINSGVSIDDVLDDFFEIGYNTNILNEKLEALGFEKGMSARKKKFILHEMLSYKVDQLFPRITPESFIGGVLPKGITKISYTVDLSGLIPVSLKQGENHDI